MKFLHAASARGEHFEIVVMVESARIKLYLYAVRVNAKCCHVDSELHLYTSHYGSR